MENLAQFLEMGGYARFVWPSFGLTFVVLTGLVVISRRALKAAEAELAALRRSGSASKNPLAALSAREFEILRMLVAAKSREDIADTLHLSLKTVLNIHYQIKSKLGVSTDIELMHAARQLGLID